MDQIRKLKEDLADLEKSFSNKEKELDDFMATFASDQSKYDDAADKRAAALENEKKSIKSQIAEKDAELEKLERLERMNADRLERQRKQDKSYVAANKETDETGAMKQFSFHRAIDLASRDKQLDGAEGEVHQEATRLAKASGIPVSGNIALPSSAMELRSDSQIQKAMSVGTTTTGGHGVATVTMPLIPVLRPRLKVVEAGTQVRSGMVGNLKFYRHTTVETASVNTEVGSGNEVTPTFDTFSASPFRVECYTTVSKQLLIQNPEIGETWIRQNLEFAVQKKLDSLVLEGAGTTEPYGLSNISGVGSVSWDALDPFGSLVDLETAIAIDNADVDNMKYMVTPGIKGTLKQTRIDPGSGIMIWGQGATDVNGYMALVSTQVPINTTPDPDEHTIYFGNWADGSIFQWGMIDIVVDPYSLRRTAQVEIVINGWYDYQVNHPESFAIIEDAVL
jgi:HK97 family phage major capsid protein